MAGVVRPLEVVGDSGWFTAHYDHVHCTYVGPQIDDRSFARLAEQLAVDIDGRRPNRRIGVLYHTPETAAMDSPRRRQIAKILEDRQAQLQQTTAAYALATRSPFIRGVLNTLFWMAPPGYPYKVVTTPVQGLEFIATHTPINAVELAHSFESLVAEQLRQAS